MIFRARQPIDDGADHRSLSEVVTIRCKPRAVVDLGVLVCVQRQLQPSRGTLRETRTARFDVGRRATNFYIKRNSV
jgi:hypothetical protein